MKKFTKKALRELKKDKEFNNRVEKKVINDLINTGLSTEELKDHIKDIVQCGCISGIVPSLVYYSDTTKFFNCYRKEILSMLQDPDKNIYSEYIYLLSYKKYSVSEKNSLSWFAYDNTVIRIAFYFNLI